MRDDRIECRSTGRHQGEDGMELRKKGLINDILNKRIKDKLLNCTLP